MFEPADEVDQLDPAEAAMGAVACEMSAPDPVAQGLGGNTQSAGGGAEAQEMARAGGETFEDQASPLGDAPSDGAAFPRETGSASALRFGRRGKAG